MFSYFFFLSVKTEATAAPNKVQLCDRRSDIEASIEACYWCFFNHARQQLWLNYGHFKIV